MRGTNGDVHRVGRSSLRNGPTLSQGMSDGEGAGHGSEDRDSRQSGGPTPCSLGIAVSGFLQNQR